MKIDKEVSVLGVIRGNEEEVFIGEILIVLRSFGV
jgi:hypothetical protein